MKNFKIVVWIFLIGLMVIFSACGIISYFFSKSKYLPEVSYLDYFRKETSYSGPLSKFNFCYARPVDFYTIGWVKVEKKDVTFNGKDALGELIASKADDKFYFYEGRAICPPKDSQYINWTVQGKRSRFWMAYDVKDEFLWFVEELKGE